MVEYPESSERLFKEVLELLVSHQRITGAHADEVISQYRQFVSTVVKEHRDRFISFNKDSDRLDTFLSVFLSSPSYSHLFMVVKMLSILSHGQAQVERGFSVNSQLLVDNLHDESLIAQRIVSDHMTCNQIKSYELKIRRPDPDIFPV